MATAGRGKVGGNREPLQGMHLHNRRHTYFHFPLLIFYIYIYIYIYIYTHTHHEQICAYKFRVICEINTHTLFFSLKYAESYVSIF